MNAQQAFQRLQEAILSAYDPIEDVEYRRQLWAQVFITMLKHNMVVTDVKLGFRNSEAPAPAAPTCKGYPSEAEIARYESQKVEGPVMPFGKHAGVPISMLPPDYCVWAAETMQFRSAKYREAEEALKARAKRLAAQGVTKNGRKVSG